jgi:hypothetical protein
MNPLPEKSTANESVPVRLPYEKPELKRVDLAMAETLSQGCKLESDSVCVGPPTTAYEGGS